MFFRFEKLRSTPGYTENGCTNSRGPNPKNNNTLHETPLARLVTPEFVCSESLEDKDAVLDVNGKDTIQTQSGATYTQPPAECVVVE